jgi:chromate transport protein ChrA
MSSAISTAAGTAPYSLRAFLVYFVRLGTFGFGPIALAARMETDLVEERGWISRQDFVQGATAAAVGAIAGAVVILGRRALIDIPTLVIGLLTFAALVTFRKIPEPVLISYGWREWTPAASQGLVENRLEQ